MKTTPLLLACLAALVSTPRMAEAATWQLVWQDEFDGPVIDRSKWTYDLGGRGWGNNELQYYTDRDSNSYILNDDTGNGMLVIEAREESYRNRNYTSARLKTQGLHAWTYGRVEARMKVPSGQGVWPAFWMLGADITEVGWPDCGEIDVMEHVLPIGADTIRGSLHGPGFYGANSVHADRAFLAETLSSTFHDFAVEWEPTAVRWYADNALYFEATPDSVPGTWVFDHPFFLIMNLAIGGDWPGAPDASTPFPVRFLVDYIRVYRDTSLEPPPGRETLHVEGIAMGSHVKGPTWEAVATVTVHDSGHLPAAGVRVLGAWSGLIDVGVTERTTDANGMAVLNSGKVRQAGTIRFCVSDLVKTDCVYLSGTDCAEISR